MAYLAWQRSCGWPFQGQLRSHAGHARTWAICRATHAALTQHALHTHRHHLGVYLEDVYEPGTGLLSTACRKGAGPLSWVPSGLTEGLKFQCNTGEPLRLALPVGWHGLHDGVLSSSGVGGCSGRAHLARQCMHFTGILSSRLEIFTRAADGTQTFTPHACAVDAGEGAGLRRLGHAGYS